MPSIQSASSSLSCIRPPSSLLIERQPHSVSPIPSACAGDEGRPGTPPLVIPSPSPPSTESPEPRDSNKHRLTSSPSLYTSSLELISTPSSLQESKSIDGGDEACISGRTTPLNTCRGHFKGPRPVGDPALLPKTYTLEFPPPSRDSYPRSGEVLFHPPPNTAGSIEVDGLLERYAEDGAQLVEFLASQSQAREEMYPDVTLQQGILGEIWHALQNQRSLFAEAEAAKPKHNFTIGGPKELPPLSKRQRYIIHNREAPLVASLEKVSLNHAVSEGAIAGAFTFHWDHASQVPTEHQLSVLREVRGLENMHLKEDRGQDSTAETDDNQATARLSSQDLVDDARKANKKAFERTFLGVRQRSFSPLSLSPRPTPTPLSSREPRAKTAFSAVAQSASQPPSVPVLVPEWFSIFASYEMLRFDTPHPSTQFREFLNAVWKLESRIKNPETRPGWNKEWHRPDPSWSTPSRQKSGG
ncbi:hypothetical protein ACJ41O_008067 [Fusarium nematophilum]